LDTSKELFPPARLRQALKNNPALWEKLKAAKLLVGQRYYEPGLLALALGGDSKATFTTMNKDARGFAFWRPPNGFLGSSGILFRLTEPKQGNKELEIKQQLGSLTPIGIVDLPRGGKTAQRMEFFSFAPIPLLSEGK
ncbi:hypothetical protein, partial [Synechococcus sp.]